jgi:hypothetical protein
MSCLAAEAASSLGGERKQSTSRFWARLQRGFFVVWVCSTYGESAVFLPRARRSELDLCGLQTAGQLSYSFAGCL